MNKLSDLKLEVVKKLEQKIKEQDGLFLFFDNIINIILHNENNPYRLTPQKLVDVLEETLDLYQSKENNRWIRWENRTNQDEDNILTKLCPLEIAQGTHSPMQYEGRKFYKSCHDMGIYIQLIDLIKPKTIIEFGTFSGGWTTLMSKIAPTDCIIKTYDIRDCKEFNNPNIIFEKIDLQANVPDLKNTTGPRLIIEDAHRNIRNVLLEADKIVEPGDYLVVEDSFSKQTPISDFLKLAKNKYLIDTRYTNFFGKNATSANNSIFKVIEWDYLKN